MAKKEPTFLERVADEIVSRTFLEFDKIRKVGILPGNVIARMRRGKEDVTNDVMLLLKEVEKESAKAASVAKKKATTKSKGAKSPNEQK